MKLVEPSHGGRTIRIAFSIALLVASAQTRAQQTQSPLIEEQIMNLVCDKQVVVLGELPSHGEARGFQLKARIVERLVNRCGFDAVLFEAPIYDFLGFQEAVAEDRAAPAQLNRAIGGFWTSRELSDWRQWLFDQATNGQLLIGGLDDQVSASSDYARATLPGLVAAHLPAEYAAECEQKIERNLFWRYDAAQPFDDEELVALQRCAHLAADSIATKSEHGIGSPRQVMIENLPGFYDRWNNPPEVLDRDEAMYRNFRWHRKHMPADSKFVIWTATVHAARQQQGLKHKPLGSWLSDQWGDRLAAIGLTAFAGQSSMAGMKSKPLPEAPPGSLEDLATEAGTDWAYLDASALREIGIAQSRLFGRFTTADWSVYFDGVLVTRTEVAPVFEPR
ncbi:MAG: erythromycin esterase family protein [Gammaproteobacteria bacterium]|nr:erythromycin esterase family protein [Gammaproteobacteria bacterium]